jgi:hypothetical protein
LVKSIIVGILIAAAIAFAVCLYTAIDVAGEQSEIIPLTETESNRGSCLGMGDSIRVYLLLADVLV